MKQAGISVPNDANPNLMHDKVMIVDGVVVLTGSFNLSRHAEENNENLIIVKGVYIAETYEEDSKKFGEKASEVRNQWKMSRKGQNRPFKY